MLMCSHGLIFIQIVYMFQHNETSETGLAIAKCGSCYGAENPEKNITYVTYL